MLHLDCVVTGSGFEHKLIASTLAPLALLALALLWELLRVVRKRLSMKDLIK